MSITITKESKNALTITNEAKITGQDLTLAEMPWALEDDDGTLGLPGLHVTKEAKNSIVISNETKT
jgi:hypothetical protein